MPAVVRIKSGKYGSAIGLLLERGGAFQTRHERTLIVNSEQKKALEDAHLVETKGVQEGSGKEHGQKKDSACNSVRHDCCSRLQRLFSAFFLRFCHFGMNAAAGLKVGRFSIHRGPSHSLPPADLTCHAQQNQRLRPKIFRG